MKLKIVANLHNKTEYVKHIRKLKKKKKLNHGLFLKNLHRIIKFKQKASLKSYIDMNTDLRKKQKMILKKKNFNLMNIAVVGKSIENVRKHRDIKLVTTERRRNYLMS